MTTIAELPTPCLLLDLDRLERNLDAMAARASRLGVALRPHAKTHKCAEIARLQVDRGASGLTVSTLEEALAFAESGFHDLTWAFPVIPSRISGARRLAHHGVDLRLVVDSAEAVHALESTGEPFRVWLKVDCGYHRAGVDPMGTETRILARHLAAAEHLRFEGLMSHAGHTYAGERPEAVFHAAEQERDVMLEAAERLAEVGIEVPALSVGSTPGLASIDDLTGIDEVRPGNYVFYDHTQVLLGSCTTRDCALTVLSSVVSQRPTHSVCDAGALSLSKDAGPSWRQGLTMGEIFADHETGRLESDLRITSVSQEHGIVSQSVPVDERLRILPNHSCLTAACWDQYVVVRGETVVDRWRIRRERGPFELD